MATINIKQAGSIVKAAYNTIELISVGLGQLKLMIKEPIE